MPKNCGNSFGAVELEKIGNALYGFRWQTPLGRAVNVDTRRVRRWVAGTKIRESICAELIVLLKEKKKNIDTVLNDLDHLENVELKKCLE